MSRTSTNQGTANYGGMTRKKQKRIRKSSTSGIQKSENCHASGLDKALIKYPRAYKTFPDLYEEVYVKKEKFTKKGSSSTIKS